MLFHRTATAILLTTLTLTATACGGDDGKLEKGELVTKANAVCKTYQAKITAIPQPPAEGAAADSTSEAQGAAYYTKLASALGDFAGALDGLRPADDVKKDWTALTSASTDSADATKRLVAQAKAKDAAGVRTTTDELNSLSAKSTAAAKKLGLEDCGG